MAGVAWTYFLPEVALEVAGCPQLVVINAIQNAAIQFLRESELQTADLTPIDIVAGDANYTLTAPVGATLVKAEKVTVDGEPLESVSSTIDEDETGAAYAYRQESPNEIRIIRVPDADITGGLVVKAAIAPTKNADSVLVEEWIAAKYLEEIACGAKARLLMQNGKPWANPGSAEVNQRVFLAAIAEAKFTKLGGVNDAPRRTTTYYR